MFTQVRNWLGLTALEGLAGTGHAGHGHDHSPGEGHGHTHGVIDATIATTERGIWAIKWSFIILAITAALQLAVVFTSGSVALLADTIHNIADATTAIPLWIAFKLAQRKPTSTFTYGLGRVEDLAGITIVLVILFSALVAGYISIDRILHPQPIVMLAWVALAGLIGFIGNEVVAVLRIRVGREINSAALIADGYHARTDGLTSLAVVAGAFGVWLGFPLADPIIGFLITIAIFGIVWQSAKSVLIRMLDGVDPKLVAEFHHAAEHVSGVRQVVDVKARWLGHKLHADLVVQVDGALSVEQADVIARQLKQELLAHVPTLAVVNVRCQAGDTLMSAVTPTAGASHHHAPDPFKVDSILARGLLEIVGTPVGERMRLTLVQPVDGLVAAVTIDRPGAEVETLALIETPGNTRVLESAGAPGEPHEFSAQVRLSIGDRTDVLAFKMLEPVGHPH